MATHTAPPTSTLRTPSLIAGVGLLLMAALAAFGNLVAIEPLITEGDAARTATDMAASRSLFGSGIATLFAVIVLDVAVAWGLYRFFRPVNAGLSRIAAWLRVVYAVIFAVAVSRLVVALGLVGDLAQADALTASQVHVACALARQPIRRHLGRRPRPVRCPSSCRRLAYLPVRLCPETARTPARHRRRGIRG